MQGDSSDALGVCHHCSVGLCATHGTVVADPVLTHEGLVKVVALPKKARALLCRICLEALQQERP
jgi:hypothetical protein